MIDHASASEESWWTFKYSFGSILHDQIGAIFPDPRISEYDTASLIAVYYA
jgi:hypothetical protein